MFFVALSFKNLDFAQRVKERLPLETCQAEKQNTYLAKTPLFYKLNSALDCKKDFRLIRQNQAWYLANNQQLFILKSGELEELFISSLNKNISLLAPKKLFREGEGFSLKINATYPTSQDYVTLLNVYENGIVTLLQPSVKYQAGMQLPPVENQTEFKSSLLF